MTQQMALIFKGNVGQIFHIYTTPNQLFLVAKLFGGHVAVTLKPGLNSQFLMSIIYLQSEQAR